MAATTLEETFGAVKTTTGDHMPGKQKGQKKSLRRSLLNEKAESIVGEMVDIIKSQKYRNSLQRG